MSFNISIEYLDHEVQKDRQLYDLKTVSNYLMLTLMFYSNITISDGIKKFTFSGNTLLFLSCIIGNAKTMLKGEWPRTALGDEGQNYSFTMSLKGDKIVLKDDWHRTSAEFRGIEFIASYDEIYGEARRNMLWFMSKLLESAPELGLNKEFMQSKRRFDDNKYQLL